jgi:hypothetical protein
MTDTAHHGSGATHLDLATQIVALAAWLIPFSEAQAAANQPQMIGFGHYLVAKRDNKGIRFHPIKQFQIPPKVRLTPLLSHLHQRIGNLHSQSQINFVSSATSMFPIEILQHGQAPLSAGKQLFNIH